MKGMQDKAKPILKPLIKGTWTGLNVEEATHLARWFTMTVMNIDAADFDGGGVPPIERREFERSQEPPLNWNIWMGRCTGGDPYEVYHRPFKVHRVGSPILKDQTRNSQITTVKLGQAILHAVSFPPGMWNGSTIGYGRTLGVIPLFPVWGGDILNWRFAPILDRSAITRLANEFVLQMLGRKL